MGGNDAGTHTDVWENQVNYKEAEPEVAIGARVTKTVTPHRGAPSGRKVTMTNILQLTRSNPGNG